MALNYNSSLGQFNGGSNMGIQQLLSKFFATRNQGGGLNGVRSILGMGQKPIPNYNQNPSYSGENNYADFFDGEDQINGRGRYATPGANKTWAELMPIKRNLDGTYGNNAYHDWRSGPPDMTPKTLADGSVMVGDMIFNPGTYKGEYGAAAPRTQMPISRAKPLSGSITPYQNLDQFMNPPQDFGNLGSRLDQGKSLSRRGERRLNKMGYTDDQINQAAQSGGGKAGFQTALGGMETTRRAAPIQYNTSYGGDIY